MADLALTASKISAQPKSFIVTAIAAETLTTGLVCYLASSGKYGIADANAAGKQQARGLCLQAAGAGQAFPLLVSGYVDGFTITTAYDSLVYLSDTAGAVADAAGTLTVLLGRVAPAPDSDLKKLLFFNFDWLRTWA